MNIKLKMLYVSQHKNLQLKNVTNNIKIFLKIIFSISFKNVISSKSENRILKNYFKIFNENFETEYKNNTREAQHKQNTKIIYELTKVV